MRISLCVHVCAWTIPRFGQLSRNLTTKTWLDVVHTWVYRCDPMRVTKKFTGACCIGKRVSTTTSPTAIAGRDAVAREDVEVRDPVNRLC